MPSDGILTLNKIVDDMKEINLKCFKYGIDRSEIMGNLHTIENDKINFRSKKYMMIDLKTKRNCVEDCQIMDPKIVAAKYNVPLKSLKRWIQVGPARQKGLYLIIYF